MRIQHAGKKWDVWRGATTPESVGVILRPIAVKSERNRDTRLRVFHFTPDYARNYCSRLPISDQALERLAREAIDSL